MEYIMRVLNMVQAMYTLYYPEFKILQDERFPKVIKS